jgi:hypothetical protein
MGNDLADVIQARHHMDAEEIRRDQNVDQCQDAFLDAFRVSGTFGHEQ